MKEENTTSRRVIDLGRTDAKSIYAAYWREFWKRVDAGGGAGGLRVNKRSSPARGWIALEGTSVSKVFFSAVASVARRKIEADFTLENEDVAHDLFAALKEHRGEIENAFGQRLCWEKSERSRRHKHRIFLRKDGVCLRERDEWDSQHEWIIEHVGRLHRAIVGSGALRRAIQSTHA